MRYCAVRCRSSTVRGLAKCNLHKKVQTSLCSYKHSDASPNNPPVRHPDSTHSPSSDHHPGFPAHFPDFARYPPLG